VVRTPSRTSAVATEQRHERTFRLSAQGVDVLLRLFFELVLQCVNQFGVFNPIRVFGVELFQLGPCQPLDQFTGVVVACNPQVGRPIRIVVVSMNMSKT
jgi:hypothetical protein